MAMINDITKTDEKGNPITVVSVRALDDYKLWIRFSTGETKIFDFIPFLEKGEFSALNDKELFNNVYINDGVSVWCNGEISISPERLYYEGVNVWR
jgi:hypothetical protein